MVRIKLKYALKIIGLLFIFLCLCLLLIRSFLPRQLDDVNPLIACEGNLLDKSETLMIIPIYENVSIAENKTWCNFILGLNKTLAMHGVYHTYEEFYTPRDEDYIRLGMEEFRKCFGEYPQVFEAPQVALTRQNEEILEKMRFKVVGWPNMLFRKVYHCQDRGIYAIHIFGKLRLTNRFIDFI